jgi:hypothetical protein
MKESWRELGFKDKAQYVTAMILIASGIVIAFVSFAITTTIASGVLIYIAQAFICGGSIFGVSIYFKSQLGEFDTRQENKITNLINKLIDEHKDNKDSQEG